MPTIKLGIIEDEPFVQENLSAFFTELPETELLLCIDTVEGFLQELPRIGKPDVLLLDIGLPAGMSGLQGISLLKEKIPNVRIIMLTAHNDSEMIMRALKTGADSYLLKKAPLQEIQHSVVVTYRGGSSMSPEIARKVIDQLAPKPKEILTERQLQIVEALAEGLSYKMVAGRYDISVETVRDHIKKIYKKLQINSKAELLRKKWNGEI